MTVTFKQLARAARKYERARFWQETCTGDHWTENAIHVKADDAAHEVARLLVKLLASDEPLPDILCSECSSVFRAVAKPQKRNPRKAR